MGDGDGDGPRGEVRPRIVRHGRWSGGGSNNWGGEMGGGLLNGAGTGTGAGWMRRCLEAAGSTAVWRYGPGAGRGQPVVRLALAGV